MKIEYKGYDFYKSDIDKAINFIVAKIIFSEENAGTIILRGAYNKVIEFDKKEYNVIVAVGNSFMVFDYDKRTSFDIASFIKKKVIL